MFMLSVNAGSPPTTTLRTETTISPGGKYVLDYYGTRGPPSIALVFSGPSENCTISVRPDPVYMPGDARDFKIMVVLVNMVCDQRNEDKTYLWIKVTCEQLI
jgi:hypothetical protein